jgi:hypothetical protein
VGNHVAQKQAQVRLAVLAELERHLVRTQERRHQVDRLHRGQVADRLQRLELVLQRKPVAALHLRGRRAVREATRQACGGLFDQRGARRLAKAAHARVDPSAGGRDLLVRAPGEAHRVFVLARAHEDQVRVRVDEAGGDDAVGRVEALHARQARGARGDLVARADGDDAPLVDQHRAAANDRQIALDHAAQRPLGARARGARGRGARHDLARVLDDQSQIARLPQREDASRRGGAVVASIIGIFTPPRRAASIASG